MTDSRERSGADDRADSPAATATAVAEEHDGKTVAAVVRARLDIPWSRARALVHRGRVQLGGRPVDDPAQRVRAGDDLVITAQAARPRDPPIVLLHVDRDVVVVDKPAGILSVPFEGSERDTLVHRAHAALRRRESGRHLPPLRVVQRLDKDTSGVLVFARHRRAERALGAQFREHSVHRQYVGLTYGRAVSATHDTWLVPDRGDRRRGSVRGHGPPPARARRAITHVEVLARYAPIGMRWTPGTHAMTEAISYVSCTLETGRQHQIRIHLGEQRTPLVGERVYDRDYQGPRLTAADGGASRPMLHAQTLHFMHPTRDLLMRFSSKLPSDFADLLDRLQADSG